LHYYSNKFTDAVRMDHAATTHLNRIAIAPAAAHQTGVPITYHQLARETDSEVARASVINLFDTLEQSGPVQSRGQCFPHAAAAAQQQMSNDYDGHDRDVKEGRTAEAREFRDENLIGYPHFPASELPTHALRYGFGRKQIGELASHRLQPGYGLGPDGDKNTPQHPYLGKMFVTLSTPEQLAAQGVRPVVAAHNARDLTLRPEVAPEREVDFPGGAEANVMFFEQLITVPDFSKPLRDPQNQSAGLSQREFVNFKVRLVRFTNDAERVRIETELVDRLIEIHEEALVRLVVDEVKRREGYLVFQRSATKYALMPSDIRQPNGRFFTSRRDKELVDIAMRAQFSDASASASAGSGAASASAAGVWPAAAGPAVLAAAAAEVAPTPPAAPPETEQATAEDMRPPAGSAAIPASTAVRFVGVFGADTPAAAGVAERAVVRAPGDARRASEREVGAPLSDEAAESDQKRARPAGPS
jgi:hypothetical protein